MALLTGPTLISAAKKAAKKAGAPNEIALFEKPLQSLSYEGLADAVADMGFDGIEATV
ncbi:MAG: hypothetical protein ACJASX_002733, partial [Limisphaerales bacterium]